MCNQQRLILACAYAVWSQPLLVARIFYDCWATDWTAFGVSKLNRRLCMLVCLFMSKCHIVGNHILRPLTRANLNFVACKQQRSEPACTSLQAGQGLCYWLSVKFNSYTCSMQTFTILASLCSWAGWFESNLVSDHKDNFPQVEAHLISQSVTLTSWPLLWFKMI